MTPKKCQRQIDHDGHKCGKPAKWFGAHWAGAPLSYTLSICDQHREGLHDIRPIPDMENKGDLGLLGPLP